MKALTASLFVLSSILAANVSSADTTKTRSDRACVFSSQPDNWQVLDNQHLVLWASQHEAYLVTLFSPLTGMKFSENLAFIDGDHNGMICGDGGDKISLVGEPAPGFPATITNMRRVDDAELLALGEQYKVKLLSNKQEQAVKQHDKQVPAQPSAAKSE